MTHMPDIPPIQLPPAGLSPDFDAFHDEIRALGQTDVLDAGKLVVDLFNAAVDARYRLRGDDVADMHHGDVPLLQATNTVMHHVVLGTPATVRTRFDPDIFGIRKPTPDLSGVVSHYSLRIGRHYSASISVASSDVPPGGVGHSSYSTSAELRPDVGRPDKQPLKTLSILPAAFPGLQERYARLFTGR